MENKFVQEIKEIEAELLALKTGNEYTSIRPANYTSTTNVYTGTYQINYAASNEHIFSIVACKNTGQWTGTVFPRTPGANHQIVEITTDHLDESGTSWVTDNCPISVISNRAVNSIQRI